MSASLIPEQIIAEAESLLAEGDHMARAALGNLMAKHARWFIDMAIRACAVEPEEVREMRKLLEQAVRESWGKSTWIEKARAVLERLSTAGGPR